MLSIPFANFYYFIPVAILLITYSSLIIINYLFYIKNFLFTKTKNKKKFLINEQNNKIYLFHFSVLTIYVNFIHFNFSFVNKTISELNNIKLNLLLFFIFSVLAIIIAFLYKLNYYASTYTINYNQYISIFYAVIFFFILFCNNFIIFFFFLEFLAYIFYLQFLQIFDKIKTKNKTNFYLDSLLMYYWLNFFGSFLLMYSIISLFLEFNTTNFLELNIFFNYNDKIKTSQFFFFIGFNLKLGLPGFHFFKAEIYKNLKLDSILNFSFLSLFGYLSLIKVVICSTFFNFAPFYVFFVPIAIIIFMHNLKINNIVLFFGLSTILNALIAVLLII